MWTINSPTRRRHETERERIYRLQNPLPNFDALTFEYESDLKHSSEFSDYDRIMHEDSNLSKHVDTLVSSGMSAHNEERPRDSNPDDLVFTIYKSTKPSGIYIKILEEFEKLLALTGLDKRKEGGVQKRREITFHSLRRFVKTVISDQTNKDYSEWFLGHYKSPYYTKKEPDRRETYSTKCMRYLTFLDYKTLELTGKGIEAQLSEKEKEIQVLRLRESVNTDAIQNLSDQLIQVMAEVKELKKRQG
jgi:hypothetical protein